jgi:predicted phosphodiesterase
VLGDLVGYGADPNAVVDRVRELSPLAVIRGNHDKAACGLDDGSGFNNVARIAATWTLEQLTEEQPRVPPRAAAGPDAIDPLFEICHGAPFDEDYYIFNGDDAVRALAASSRPLCLFGHTHIPMAFQRDQQRLGGFTPQGDVDLELREECGVSDQSGLCGATAGRRSAGGLRGAGRGRADAGAAARGVQRSAPRSAGSWMRGCRRVWRTGWGLDGSFQRSADSCQLQLSPLARSSRRRQVGGVGVARGAGAQDPADHHAHQHRRRDEDEVRGGDLTHQRRASGWMRRADVGQLLLDAAQPLPENHR